MVPAGCCTVRSIWIASVVDGTPFTWIVPNLYHTDPSYSTLGTTSLVRRLAPPLPLRTVTWNDGGFKTCHSPGSLIWNHRV